LGKGTGVKSVKDRVRALLEQEEKGEREESFGGEVVSW